MVTWEEKYNRNDPPSPGDENPFYVAQVGKYEVVASINGRRWGYDIFVPHEFGGKTCIREGYSNAKTAEAAKAEALTKIPLDGLSTLTLDDVRAILEATEATAKASPWPWMADSAVAFLKQEIQKREVA